jgi:two-component system, chemotaxis family, chemotaxis protein CheY
MPSPLPISVMCIHDAAGMKAIVSAILRGSGIRSIRNAETPNEMMEAMVAKPPDLIICDHNETLRGNVDLVKRIRSCEPEGIQYLPVIYIARHTEEINIQAARDVGATEILARPISARGLLMRIDNIIRNPRDFVRCKTYFGPDRRRRREPFSGEERRIDPPISRNDPDDKPRSATEMAWDIKSTKLI